MAINLRRDAWTDERQYDDIRSLVFEIDRLKSQTEHRFGTWVPALTFGGSSAGVTYAVQDGHWMRQGSLVICSGAVDLTNNGTGVGNVVLTGLPFNVKNILPNAGSEGLGNLAVFGNRGTAMDDAYVALVSGTKTAGLFKVADGATVISFLIDTDVGNAGTFRFFFVYFTDDT